MKRTRIFTLLVLLMASHLALFSQRRQEQADSLHKTLRAGMTPNDSIRILYDVFDLSRQSEKVKVGDEMIGVAVRAKRFDVIKDMVPQLAAFEYENRGRFDELHKVADLLPEGNDKKSVQTFIEVQKAVYDGQYAAPDERQKILVEYLKEDINTKEDEYQNLLDLYRVVLFLGYSTDGNMYMEYLERLEKMLNTMPDNSDAFHSRFYTTAANYYTRKGLPEKAVAADKNLLKLIDKMDKRYKEQGRRYRNYDRYRYLCYLRMLSNYKALSLKEVEDLYNKCKELAPGSPDLENDFFVKKRPEAYMLLKKGKYAEAVPLLETALATTSNQTTRLNMLAELKAAADSSNNEKALLGALKEYNERLEKRLQMSSEEAMLELRMRYEVKRIEEEKRQAELQKHQLEIESDEKLISISLIALFVLAVILMFLYKSHFSLIHKSRDLKDDNQKLRDRIEELLYDGNIPGSEELPTRPNGNKPKGDKQ
ncbi:MAG: hypothetical protein K2K64_01530 [Muribaculaceae bacterium]|nr:hypothetical protein [Muribaculaceae bacterium]